MIETHQVVEASLYARHRDELMRFATSVVGVSDAADVLSQAMTKLIASGALQDAINPRALMYRTVFNEAKSMQRSGIRRVLRERKTAKSILAFDPELDPDVVRAVVALPHQQRAVIWMTYWAGRSVAKVDVLGQKSEGGCQTSDVGYGSCWVLRVRRRRPGGEVSSMR